MMEIFYLDAEEIKTKKSTKTSTAKPFWSDVTDLTAVPLHTAGVDELEGVKDKWLWIDITNITKNEGELLKNTFGLHAVTVEDLFTERSRIKVEEFPNYLFCVFYAIYRNKRIELQDIDFVVGPNYIITNHKKNSVVFQSFKSKPELISLVLKRGKEYLFHRLLALVLQNYPPVLEYFDLRIERLEEKATTHPHPTVVDEILKLKRTIVVVKRMVHSQREKISFLAKNEYPFLPKKVLPYFRDLYDQSIWITDRIDNLRDAVTSIFDAYTSAVTQSLNEIMKVLSIIATIALPLTVISGIYGTNFTTLPGAGTSYGFWIMVGAMFSLCVGMLFFFRKRHWI